MSDQNSSKSINSDKAVDSVGMTEKSFMKRECIRFIKTTDDPERCGCGRRASDHDYLIDGPSSVKTPQAGLSSSTSPAKPSAAGDESGKNSTAGSWSIANDTKEYPTDAYGLIEFQGGPHAHKAKFVRLAFDSEPETVLKLLEERWQLGRPKLVITIYGSIDDFPMNPKLVKAFCKGLTKVVRTTGAWIICHGVDSGVAKYVQATFSSHRLQQKLNETRAKRKPVLIGIAPWGMLKNGADFVVKEEEVNNQTCPISCGIAAQVNYHGRSQYHPQSPYAALLETYTHFLLVDDGTTHRYGADVVLRRRLEEYIRQQPLSSISHKRVPVVGVVLKGGVATLRTVLDFVTHAPGVPVVAVDGSGGAADCIGFVEKHNENVRPLPDKTKRQMKSIIGKEFKCENRQQQVDLIFNMLMYCARRKKKLCVFRFGETSQDFDNALLTGILKAQKTLPGDRLQLTLTWNRPDIAAEHVLAMKPQWDQAILNGFMMEALSLDRVEFVQLLSANGVCMKKFLTPAKLVSLYNKTEGAGTLRASMEDVTADAKYHGYKYTLPDIGALLRRLMGGVYDASEYRNGKISPFPFNDLFIWAVLTKRHAMALCMWKNGPESLAKALIGIKLNESMSQEAADEPRADEICPDFDKAAEDFRRLSLQILTRCYEEDDDKTLQLLTRELPNWGHETCLYLAVRAGHIEFMANPACQLLLSDLWQGGLHVRRYMTPLVLWAVIFPPALFCLEYKTKQELMLQAQRVEELSVKPSNDRSASSQRRVVAPPVAHAVRLNVLEKVYEFYAAPITKFWIWTISYLIFLPIYTWFVLVATPAKFDAWQEWFIITYAGVYGCELIREFLMSEPKNFRQKLCAYVRQMWRMVMTLAVLTLFMATGLRMLKDNATTTRLIYTCNIVLWYSRLLNIMGIHNLIGPYTIMFGKTLMSFLNLSPIFMILLAAYGVAVQAIQATSEDTWRWGYLRDVVYKPYFMIFGEVFRKEIDTCSEENNYKSCGEGHWIPPILQAVYLLIMNVLLLNLLIATFTNIYMEVNAVSLTLWKFNRYDQIMEYEQKPLIPPPLSIIVYIYMLLKYLVCRICCKDKRAFDQALKLILDEEKTTMILEFESKAMDDLNKQKEMEAMDNPVESIARADDKSEFVAMKLDDIMSKVTWMKESVHRMRVAMKLPSIDTVSESA